MTLLYLLLGALAIWIAFKVLAKPRKVQPKSQPQRYEMPIKIPVSYDDGTSEHQPTETISPTRRARHSTCAGLARNVRASRTRLRLQVARRPSCQAGPYAAA